MEKTLLKMEKYMTRDEISKNLRKIADGVEKGEISLSSAEDSVDLDLPEEMEFEIEVEEEGNDKSLEIEIEWEPGKAKKDIEIE